MKEGTISIPSLGVTHKEGNMGGQQYTAESKNVVKIRRWCRECGQMFWQLIPLSAFFGPGELPDMEEKKLCDWCTEPEEVVVQ